MSFQPPQLLLGFNEANVALFLSHERKKRAARSHALGTAGPGVGAPRATKPRPLSRSSENRVPREGRSCEKAALRGIWERREGAWPDFSTCFGASLEGGESQDYLVGEPSPRAPSSSSAWLAQFQGSRR